MFKNPIITLFLFLLITISPLFSEEEQKSVSLREERTQIIKYGIDSEVINLITDLKKEKNSDFDKDLADLLETSKNEKLKETIVAFFKEEKKDNAVDFVFDEIQNNYSLSNETIIKYINYISDFGNDEITDYLITLINHDYEPLANAAIEAVGDSGKSSYGKVLLELLTDPDTTDSKKIHIINALGKLKYRKAVEEISKFLEKDYTDNRSLKWKACTALGEIGDESSLPVLERIFSENDPYLRKYAIEALGYFPDKKTEDIIIQGLRDSSWRVRVSAADSLGRMKSKKAVPILIYKAGKDPDVKNVRNHAIESLAEIGTHEALEYLRSLILDEKSPMQNRTTALSALIENDLDNSIKSITELIETEWDKKNSPILDYTCKLLSQTKNPKLKKLYEKMMEYTVTVNLKIYALRGIKLNKMSSLKDKVSELTEEEQDKRVQKIAKDVLSGL